MATLNYALKTMELAKKAYEEEYDVHYEAFKSKKETMTPEEKEKALDDIVTCAMKARDAVLERREHEFSQAVKFNEEVLKPIVAMYKTPENNNNKCQYYLVTIRPDPKKDVKWNDFKAACEKFAKTKQSTEMAWSFEQKGESESTLGVGFHCHYVLKWPRGFSNLLQQLNQKFLSKFCGPSGIQVDGTYGPYELVQNYLIDYESKDKHKILTKEWDTLWREQNGIDPLYTKGWGGNQVQVPPQS